MGPLDTYGPWCDARTAPPLVRPVDSGRESQHSSTMLQQFSCQPNIQLCSFSMSNIRPSEFQELRSETNKILHFLAPERT